MNVRCIVAGWNYSFGRKGRGNASFLNEDGQKHGYDVLIVPPETLDDGTPISSSLVRKLLREGKINEVNNLLGHAFTLTGTVKDGKHLGHHLGFPTANILTWKRKALPKHGVYTCVAEIKEKIFPAVVNIGIQPTIPSGEVTIEAHILEDCPNMYGRKIRLTPMMLLREERQFDSLQALKEQIEKDCIQARKMFDMA